MKAGFYIAYLFLKKLFLDVLIAIISFFIEITKWRKLIIMIFCVITLIAAIKVCFQINRFIINYNNITASDCNLLIGLSALFIALVALSEDVSNIFNPAHWKSLLMKFLILIFACDLGYISTQKKDDLNEAQLIKEKKSNEAKNIQRDKVFNDSLKIQTKEVQDNMLIGLAKYFNMSKSEQQAVVKLMQDSLKQIKKAPEISPDVFIDKIIINNVGDDKYFLKINIQCQKARAKDVDFEIKIIGQNGNNFFYIANPDENLYHSLYLNENRNDTITRLLYAQKLAETYWFKVNGTFKSAEGKVIDYNPILGYNVKEKSFGGPSNKNILDLVTSKFQELSPKNNSPR